MIRLDNINYSVNGFHLLKNISLTINKKDFFLIAGVNGAGKSLLARVLSGLIKPSSGSYFFKNKVFDSSSRSSFGVALQDPDEQIFCTSVKNEVDFAAKNFNKSSKTKDIIDLFDLTKILDFDPRELSFGLRKWLSIASIFSHDPEVIILDEPFIGLDFIHKKRLINIFNKFKEKTFIIISHDIRLLRSKLTRGVLLDKGSVINNSLEVDSWPIIK